MKKILVLSSFLVLGVMAFAQNAQTAPVNQQPASLKATATLTPVITNIEVTEAVADAPVEKKKDVKKECSAAEKKACNTKASGKKSCCSSKTEAKKED